MYQIIDENEEQKKYNEVVNKITPQSLGLNPTTDFELYAQQTLIDEDPEKVKGYIDKGSIGVLEAGKRYAEEFRGNYDNIDNNVHLTAFGNALKKTSNYSKTVEERIAKNKQKKEERNQKIKNGSASFLDKIGAGLDEWGKASYQAQVKQAQQQADLQMPNKDNPNFRYEIAGVSKSGNVIYNEVDLRKKIDFAEALADSIGEGRAMPFVSGAITGSTIKKYRNIADRIKNNEAIRQDELDFFNHYNERRNEEFIRGYTIGGQIGKSILPSLLAFGSEILLGGAVLKGLGLAGKGKALGLSTGTALLKSGKVSKDIAKGVAFATGELAEAGLSAGITTAVNPSRIFTTYQERRLNDEMKITDRGTLIFKEAEETPAKAFFKSLGQVYISYFAEGLGGLLSGAGRGFKSLGATQFEKIMKASPALENFIKKTSPLLAKAYEKLNKLPIKGKSVEWLKGQVKFDGFLEEIGEEVLEDILNLTFGTENEERSLENYISKIKKTPEEWVVLAGVIALQGGTLSIAGNALGTYMETKGSSFEDIANVSLNSTEAEKIEILDEAIKNGDITISENALYDEQEIARNEVEENVYNKLLDGNVSEDIAFSNAKLVGQFFSKWNKKGQEVFKKAVENLSVRYNIPQDQSRKEHMRQLYEQSKYARKTIQKAQEVKQALQKITNGSEEETVKNLRNDLEQYGGTNDVTFIFGDDKKGIKHIAQKHGVKTLLGVFDAVIDGKVERFVKNKKTIILKKNDIEAVLSLDENGKKKTWLLTGWNIKISPDEEGQFSANPNSTQIKPIFSRQDLGAELINSINDDNGIFNPNIKTYEQSAYHGTPHNFDKFSTEHIGSGEGNQVHGWGLYFAEDKNVSEGYFKRLSGDKVFYDGQELEKSYVYTHLIERGIDKEQNKYLSNIRFIIDRISQIKGEKNISLEEARQEFINIYEQKEKLLTFQKKILELAKNIDVNKIELQKGQLFEVDIPETDEMLDEDKLLSEQSDIVKKAIIEYYKSRPDYIAPKSDKDFPSHTGRNFYNDVAFQMQREGKENPQKEASLLLNSLGIKGITYDGRRDGRCYVVFDDKAVNVLKTYYQNQNEGEEEKLIAGFTYSEVLDKLTELYNEMSTDGLSKDEIDKLIAKTHVLENAFEVAENPHKFSNEDYRNEVMLNAYYIMNNQEIPEEYIEADKATQRSYRDYVELHKKKKEEKEKQYLGYFDKVNEKSFITIMQNSNASTALHELAHFFLESLNEVARVDENAREQLTQVNKWLGSTGEYTIEQHEKFARSFEAYLYRGKAPNNTLRQVFENFKEWLKTAYEHIMDLVDKGADITPEVTEMFDKMFSDDEYIEEAKQTRELLKKVKEISRNEKMSKVSTRDDNSLDEVEKRHKEVCYEIVSKGTGKSIKYLKSIFETASSRKSFAKKRENIEMLLDSVDDKITVQDGFQRHWAEFFSDTGVSYDNDEVDGDYKLVEKALDVIINKAYRNPEKEADSYMEERALYFEKTIDEADRQYKLLIRSFKKENRNVALSAIYEWLENLDSEIKQDYEDRFIYDSAIIEREEKVDKFDKAKRQILAKAMEVENRYNLTKDEKYKEVVLEIMKNLNFLQPADKAKLTTNILDVSSLEFLMASIDNIMDIAKTMEDVNYRRKLERDIHAELQKTKNVKKGGRSVGKYDYKTNKIFEELRELDRLSPEQAQDLLVQKWETISNMEEKGLSDKQKLLNKFLTYKAGGRTFADTEAMKAIYDEITRIKLIGKGVKTEQELNEKLGIEKEVKKLINIVKNKKVAKGITKFYHNAFANLETAVNTIFNKEIKEKYASEILYDSTQATAWAWQKKTAVQNAIAEIYNVKKWDWQRPIIKYLSEKFTFNEFRRRYDENNELLSSEIIEREFTKMEIINAYIQSKNEVGEKRLINQFGEETLEAMFDEMSLEDVKLAELLMNTVQSFYNMVNKTYIQKYGLNLPRVSNYFPFTPERISDTETYSEYMAQSYGFTKARAKSETLPMDFHNPLEIVFSHIDKVAKFCFMSENLDRANAVFKDPHLKRFIINKYGDKAYRTLEQQLMNVSCRKQNALENECDTILGNITNNWTLANVSIKASTGVKQLLASLNYSTGMPFLTWQKGFLNGLAHPKETIDYMMKIPYLQARFHGGTANEALKQVVNSSKLSRIKTLNQFLTLNIRLGDIGAIIFGGKPYIDYLIKEKGMSEEQAIKEFVLFSNRTQQSGEIAALSNYQVSWSKDSVKRVLTAYRNSQQQYVRICGDSLISVANGDMSKKECAKIIFNFAFLQPYLFAVATSGSLLKYILTGDDDDLIYDLKTSIFNLGTDSLAFVGEVYRYVINLIAGGKKRQAQELPVFGEMIREINKISKEDVELVDVVGFLSYIGGKLALGVDLNHNVGNSLIGGTSDIIKGKPLKGALRLYGMTENRAKIITGEKK